MLIETNGENGNKKVTTNAWVFKLLIAGLPLVGTMCGAGITTGVYKHTIDTHEIKLNVHDQQFRDTNNKLETMRIENKNEFQIINDRLLDIIDRLPDRSK